MKRMLSLIAIVGSLWACDMPTTPGGADGPPSLQTATLASSPGQCPARHHRPSRRWGSQRRQWLSLRSTSSSGRSSATTCIRHYPRLVLRETTGASRASIRSITIAVADQILFILKPAQSPGCFTLAGSDTVPAGGTWSMDQVYLYCLDVDTSVILSGTKASVVVDFTDADGHVGSVSGTTTVR